MTFSITFDADERPVAIAGRHCGDCQLCCKLLPVRELDKGAGERCRHQRVGKGCMVYHKAGMPMSCKLWSCRWLVNPDTIHMSRPDRAHYVVDIMPDFITAKQGDDGPRQSFEVVQVWLDPNFPDAHRDPALRSYLDGLGKLALIRLNSADAFVLVPPSVSHDGEWIEHHDTTTHHETHTPQEIGAAIGRFMP